MALYLNNLDLNGNQLQKAVVHPLSTAPSTAQEGQIYYDTGTNAVYVNTSTTANSPAWVSMAGDMTGITLTGGNGITATNTNSSGGAYSSTITLDISDSTLTTETAIAQADLLAFSDESATNDPTKNITFSNLEDQIFSNINSASSDIAIAAGGAITVNTLNQNTTGSAGSVANALTVDNTTVKLSSGTTYNGSAALTISAKTASIADGGTALATADQIHTFVTGASTTGNAATVTTNANLTGHITSSGNAAVLGSFTVAQLSTALSDANISGNNTGDQTLPTDFVSAASGGTFSGNVSFGDNNISNVGDIALDTITADGNHITIGNQASKTINLGKANTVTGGNPTDPSVETGVVVKGSLTVDGKLTVAGDFETTSTSNTIIKDKIIQLNSGASGANSADFGFVFNRGSEQNVAFRWDESELNFDLIATASSADSGTIDPYDPNSDGESQAGTTNWQNFRAAGITSLTGFSGPGGSITALNGSNISSGTVAAARVGSLATSKITRGTFANARISSGSVTQHVGSIDHDSLLNCASNEHFTQANITTVGTIGTGTWQGSVIASAYLDSDTAHLTGAQTFSGTKTFSGGIILDDGSGASPVLKFKNEADTHWTVQNDNSNNLKFTQATDLRVTFNAGGDVTIPGSIDLGGSIDVDGTMEADAITLAGSNVHATDTNTSLGTSDTVVPSQNAVKTYVDAQGSSSSNTGGRQAFVLGHATSGVAGNTGSADGNNIFTITHGMGASRNYGVEVIRNGNNSGGGETVIVDVTRPSDTTIVITFAAAVTALDYTALVCKY